MRKTTTKPAKVRFTSTKPSVQFEEVPPACRGDKWEVACVATQQIGRVFIDSDVYYGATRAEAEKAALAGLRREIARVFKAAAWKKAS